MLIEMKLLTLSSVIQQRHHLLMKLTHLNRILNVARFNFLS